MAEPRYCSDLTDLEWALIKPLLPGPGSPAGDDLRLVINGICFLVRSGTSMRTVPPWSIAESYFRQWQADGTWDRIAAALQAVGPTWALPPEPHQEQGG